MSRLESNRYRNLRDTTLGIARYRGLTRFVQLAAPIMIDSDMNQSLANVVDLEQYPLEGGDFRAECKRTLDESGALVMHKFVKPAAIASVQGEGELNQHLAYYAVRSHNIYLEPSDSQYPADHPRNRQVSSSKGCITFSFCPSSIALRGSDAYG